MQQTDILLPMLALSGWTFIVLLMIPYQRFKAGYAGLVKVDDFRFGESVSVPAAVSMPNRNLMNLLEVPVLFYVFVMTLYLTQNVDAISLGLAWIYILLRLAHSVVHLTYNKVMHRLIFFAASNVILSLVWMDLVADIVFRAKTH